jgi:hypothetical protein
VTDGPATTLTELCGPHCGTKDSVTRHCADCHDAALARALDTDGYPIHDE